MTSLAVIHISDVPLYLAAGPAYDVSSNNGHSAEAIERLLLSEDDDDNSQAQDANPSWDLACQQSTRGLLVGIESRESQNAITEGSRPSELLLYAAIVQTPRPSIEGLPTPPRSSSPIPDAVNAITLNDHNIQLRVFALPLRRPNVAPFDYQKDWGTDGSLAGRPKAFFLPATDSTDLNTQDAPAIKRRKIANVFEDATKNRKRLKSHGGEGVSKTMAEAVPSLNRTNSTFAEQSKDKEGPINSVEHQQAGDVRRRSLSRASSAVSVRSYEPSRPSSRRDSFVPGKRSGLNRVESVLSVSGPASPSIPDDTNTLEKQNTAALSRLVMAGMRMYGLQQKKKKGSRQASQSREEQDTADPTQANPDEYKVVYHQTFKGACFTFRNHFPNFLVPQDAVREVVDRLLLMFCTDPLAKPETDHPGDPIFGSQEDPMMNTAFDLPSATVSTAIALTPSFRKSKHGDRG